MLCASWLKAEDEQPRGRLQQWGDRLQTRVLAFYGRSLDWALRHSLLMVISLLATIALNVYLFVSIPKTFMPQQDTGQLIGFIRGDDGLSFQVMKPKMEIFRRAVLADPAVDSVAGFIGGAGGINNAFMIVRLKPIS